MNSIITVFAIFVFPAFILCLIVDQNFFRGKNYFRKSIGNFLFALYAMIMEVYTVEYLLHPGRVIDFSASGDHATDPRFIVTRTAFCLASSLVLGLIIRVIMKKMQHKCGNQNHE